MAASGPAFAHTGHGPHAFHLSDLLPPPDQALVLLAAGLAMGRQESDGGQAPVGTVVIGLIAGLGLGAIFGGGIPEILRAATLMLCGLLLIDPWARLGPVTWPLLGVLGVAAGLVWGRDIPLEGAWPIYLGTAAAGGLLLSVAGLLLWQRAYQPWFRIAIRIVGSWMAAIGTILLGAAFR